MDIKLLREEIRREEGQFHPLGFDTEGVVTFGVGHNMQANPFTPAQHKVGKILGYSSQEFIDYIFDEDIRKTCIEAAQGLTGIKFTQQPEKVQRALVNMAFQMGVRGVWEFMNGSGTDDAKEDFLSCNYNSAAKKLYSSKWAKQTPGRAIRVTAQISECQGMGLRVA